MPIVVEMIKSLAKRRTRGVYMDVPSLSSGAVRLLDIWGQFDADEFARWRNRADEGAIRHDWSVVGRDFKIAMKDTNREALET
jgi:hypothetical protein